MSRPNCRYDDLDAVELRETLIQRDKQLAEERAAREEADASAAKWAEIIEISQETRESWIEVFDMQMNPETGAWAFDSEQTKLWEEHAALWEEHGKLLREFNEMVPVWNAKVSTSAPRRGVGRPLEASPVQISQVQRLRDEGRSLRAIASQTFLSLQTVRSILGRAQRKAEEDRLKRRREFNKAAAARFRARKRARDQLPGRINKVHVDSNKALKEARRMGLLNAKDT